jgi:hypothetical protein
MPPHDPDPSSIWLLCLRLLIVIAFVLGQTGITMLLLTWVKEPKRRFQILTVHWLAWGTVLGFACALQYVVFASPMQRLSLASIVAWWAGAGMCLVALGLWFAAGARVEGTPLLGALIRPPESATSRSVRGRGTWAIMCTGLGLGVLTQALVLAMASGV